MLYIFKQYLSQFRYFNKVAQQFPSLCTLKLFIKQEKTPRLSPQNKLLMSPSMNAYCSACFLQHVFCLTKFASIGGSCKIVPAPAVFKNFKKQAMAILL